MNVQGTQLRLVFHINKSDTGYTSTMDSPDQGAHGIPVTATDFESSILTISMPNLGIEYEGTLGADYIVNGNFKQAGQSFPLSLSKSEKSEKLNRPQEPIKPYPYHEESVSFENKDAGIKLSGTLTLPEKAGVFPAVILISGSGPQNRDEEVMGHKPFLVLSDYLTKKGLAVLRFDDRGVGASTGDFKVATSVDFSKDVEAGIQFLKTRKDIDEEKIGLIGHSEGGLIASLVASTSKDVSFIVLLAGTGVSGDQILLSQQKLIGSASGIDQNVLKKAEALNKGAFEIVKKSKDDSELKVDLIDYLKKNGIPDNGIASTVDQLTSPWMKYFIQYDPSSALESVKCPVLALNGEKDLQVSPKENLEAIEKSLIKGGNKKVTVKELPGLNHLFQESKTGLPTEYATIEQTFSPAALVEISNWIGEQTK